MQVIIAQILGIIALIITVICYQLNSHKKILICQIAASTLFSIDLFLLGAYTGTLLNIIGICRGVVFYQREKYKWANSKLVPAFFMVAAAVCVAVTYKSPVDLIPLIGIESTTIALYVKNPKYIRLFTLPSPPSWLVYNVVNGNIGGIMNEIFVFTSIIIAMIRYDIPKRRKAASASGNNSGEDGAE